MYTFVFLYVHTFPKDYITTCILSDACSDIVHIYTCMQACVYVGTEM